ncbi:MAG TPA: monovalent cation:proton antiporter-2 (CPA2) family protein [Amaricoccus sp.]|uniref:monovalent cation:proton antiporter-2 (CPA2) family protein n=1 Tax=Amaricoccus sp. TaxID=1872485 RepID=UPI002CF2E264|nr:monovalent cation:proton antiporter-2 (CPA2) family protein [Amaricoccus sp.]HPG23264.1 monovalent cation:proton antiporter-2 (CPA2) family protein [Amaricoccus sp.]HRW16776.1 monovalent cation:proton antiporter-2 (CPA2) family protein [Amaricoccus sp.]
MQQVLLEILVYLVAAIIAVPLSQRLGFGSVLGYLAAGVVIGPAFGFVGSEAEDLRHYAEFGVVLMLFLIGLELEPRALWNMRQNLIGLGGLQVAATLAAVAIFCRSVGLGWSEAMAIGMILSLSSTAIVMQTLNEKRLTRTEGGRASFAVLLFQDIAALPFLAIIPLLALGGGSHEVETHAATALIDALPVWTRALLILGAGVAVIVAGRYLTRPLYRFLAMAGLHEVYVAAALMFVVGIAAMMSILGLSPALGTFLAGVVMANSEYRHEIESDIAPFKGLLLGLFFITVGASMDLRLFADAPLRVLGLVVALMVMKILILHALAVMFRLTGRDRVLFTLSLAQAGEFGFFLASFAGQSGVVPHGRVDLVLLVISLSMFLTPALFVIHDRVIARLRAGPRRPDDDIDEEGVVIIAGMGRFGQVVNRLLVGLGHKTVVLDSHPQVINRMRKFGIKAFYGEVTRPALLEAAGIARAKAIVIAIDDADKAVEVARYVSQRHPEVRIVARARDRHHVYQLYAAGAPVSVREMFDSSVRAGRYALEALGYSDDEIERVGRTFFDHDRHMLAELAELWDPEKPMEENDAYIARARAQAAEIEAALRGELARPRKGAEKAEKDAGEAASQAAE